MAKIKLPEKPRGMLIRTYRDLSSQADPERKLNLKLSIFHLRKRDISLQLKTQ